MTDSVLRDDLFEMARPHLMCTLPPSHGMSRLSHSLEIIMTTLSRGAGISAGGGERTHLLFLKLRVLAAFVHTQLAKLHRTERGFR